MNNIIKRRIPAAAILAAVAFAFAFQACAPTSYKTQRNLAVNVADSHDANLAAAEKILADLDVNDVRESIIAEFPDVTAAHLENFGMKTNVLTIGDQPSVMIESSLAFTDTSLPANEIMDFVQAMLEAKLQAN